MWQRSAPRQPAISTPYHFTELDRDNDYCDDRYLETIPEVDSISSRRQSIQYGLPELPFRAVPPMTEIPQPVNVHSPTTPTAPSAISRSHGLRIDVNQKYQDTDERAEISPLSPRHPQRHRSIDERPVSPIEAQPQSRFHVRAPLPQNSNFVSQIPRKVSQPRDNAKQETKWDEYSGEPTTDDRGKPASVRPGTQPVEVNYPQLKERTKQILAGLREREAAKKTQWGRQPPPVAADPLDDPPQREPWKGQSVRAAIVEPVKNTVVARKVFPQAQPVELETNQPTVFYGAVTETPPLDEHPAFRNHLRYSPSEESLKPVVPLKTRNLTPDITKVSPAESPHQQSPIQSHPTSPEPFVLPSSPPIPAEQPQNRVDSPLYDSEPTTPTTPEPTILSTSDKFQSSPPPFPLAQPDMDREVSRFSWTTYETSTADSPRSTQYSRDMSPLPELPTNINIKKRPVSISPFLQSQPYTNIHYADSTGSIVRKPVPGARLRTSSLNSATSMAMSTSKSLPPTPTVLEASDKIENISAQLDSLQRRKYNVSRIVGDLEAALKKNAVTYDMWKRREVEKNITNHKISLDEIASEIHELSIQLHRAQRKRDEKQGLEASSLWIKRVTS